MKHLCKWQATCNVDWQLQDQESDGSCITCSSLASYCWQRGNAFGKGLLIFSCVSGVTRTPCLGCTTHLHRLRSPFPLQWTRHTSLICKLIC